MEYRILGPLEVAEDDREVVLGRGRQRSVLALLLLHANEVLPTERLIDELWGEAPPPTAGKTVQVYVSQLRKALRNGDGDGPLLTQGSGYVLRIRAGELDLHRFERALAEGRQALDAEAPVAAAERLRAGLALWRGPPLADFAYERFAQAEIARLDELRLAALEQRIEADLELGRHAELVSELEALVSEHPLREGLRGQLMLALYRCDRQADALAAYRLGRRLLVEELGIEPSSSLRELHEAILAQDPSLGVPSRPRRPPRTKRRAPDTTAAVRRRPRVLVAAGVALVVAAAGVAVLQAVADPGPARPAVPLDYSALAAVGANGSVDAAVALPGAGRVAAADGLVWVGGDDSDTVSAIDAKTHRLVRTVPIGVFPSDIAAGAGSLWVVDGSRGRVVRIDPDYGRILATPGFTPAGKAPADRFGFDPTAIAADDEGAWITDGSGDLLHVDARDAAEVERIEVGPPLVGVATGAGGVWAISGEAAEVVRIDPRSHEVTRLPVVADPELTSAFPRAVAAAGDLVWVLNGNTGGVIKIDPRTRSIVSTVTVGVERVPVQVAADAAGLWVASEDGSLARIDAVTDTVRFHDVGRMLRDVTVGAGGAWATNRLGDCCGQEQ